MQLLDSLPTLFSKAPNIHSATGAALQAALKLIVSPPWLSILVVNLDMNCLVWKYNVRGETKHNLDVKRSELRSN